MRRTRIAFNLLAACVVALALNVSPGRAYVTIYECIDASIINLSPAWSPDGRRIAFESNQGGLWVVNADGTGLTRLTDNRGDLRPFWSRDGRHIYFIRHDKARWDIWRAQADGLEIKVLNLTDISEWNVSTLPNGNLIVETEEGIQLYSPEGKALRQVAEPKVALGANADASPDGSEIVFIHKDANIWKCNLEKGDLTQLTTSGDLQESKPRWSPDGSRLVFADGGLRLMKSDGSGLKWLMEGKDEPDGALDLDPCWSPDGLRIAFSRNVNQSCDIWIVNADGTGLRRLTQSVAMPTFSPEGGEYSETVTISCDTPGAAIRYTTDGTEPTESGTLYSGPISLPNILTLKAKAWRKDYLPSETRDAHYGPKLPKPHFHTIGGEYQRVKRVPISCDVGGTTIRYTTDGSDPTASSAIYTAPIPLNHALTLKAKAWKTGYIPSEIQSRYYFEAKVSPLRFTPAGGNFAGCVEVAISLGLMGRIPAEYTVRYTTDGTDPTETSTLYEGPIQITQDTTLKAKAWKKDYTPSDIKSADYVIEK